MVVAIERHQDVGRHDVAVDRVGAHAQVVGVVAALDQRGVLGQVEACDSPLRAKTRASDCPAALMPKPAGPPIRMRTSRPYGAGCSMSCPPRCRARTAASGPL